MRKTLSTRPRRAAALTAAAALTGLALIMTASLAGCSSSSSGSETNAAGAGGAAFPAAAASAPASGAPALPAAIPSPAASGTAFAANGQGAEKSFGGGRTATTNLAASGEQLIYTAQLTVRAPDVLAAVDRATSIVGAVGGYVSSEDASTDPAHPDQSSATVELKIPAAEYQATLSQLTGTALGTQVSLRQQAQDVTQQVADVASRVTSDEAAIAQLRQLLKRAGSIADLLSVQNQIDSQTSDLEAMLAQQQSLNKETAYATVTVTVIGPKAPAKPKKKAKPVPPPGLGNGLSGGWHAFRLTVDWVLAILGALAPFLAAIAAIGGLAWWGRERLRRRRGQGTGR